MKRTSDRLIEKYNTFTRRSTALDISARKVQFRSFERILGKWLPHNRYDSFLDIGCGEGSLLLFLKESGYQDLSGFDLSEENVKIAHKLSLDFVSQFNALDIAYYMEGKLFDFIFLLDIIEHIPKQSVVDFLSIVLTRLKTGGTLIIQTPNMGSIYGNYLRYNDLTHEFGLTEKSILDLLLVSGLNMDEIEIHPAWNATTFFGFCREYYLRFLHLLFSLGEDSSRPKIPTKNLLIRILKK